MIQLPDILIKDIVSPEHYANYYFEIGYDEDGDPNEDCPSVDELEPDVLLDYVSKYMDFNAKYPYGNLIQWVLRDNIQSHLLEMTSCDLIRRVPDFNTWEMTEFESKFDWKHDYFHKLREEIYSLARSKARNHTKINKLKVEYSEQRKEIDSLYEKQKMEIKKKSHPLMVDLTQEQITYLLMLRGE